MKIDWKSFKKKYTKPKGNEFPTGSKVYKGYQGSGKTLSMIHDTLELKEKFPKCRIFSNVKFLKYINDETVLIENDNDLAKALYYQNGKDGVLILLDEAHLFFNKKTGISLDVLTTISQQRKDRRRLVFTSQIWEELDVSLRKQVKEVVNCRNIFGRFQINTVSNGETIHWDNKENTWTAQKIRTEIFKHNDDLYNCYDTFQKIIKNTEYKRDFATQNPVYYQNSDKKRL